MQLLVSVRSAAEVAAAVAGGADIIDAKEPSRGSLGAVAPDTLAAIFARMPADRGFSVALGDVSTTAAIVQAISSLRLPWRPSRMFVKLGFAGIRSPATVSRLIERAVAAAANHAARPRVVAVAYADAERARALTPELILQLAHQAGADGVLLDTHTKDGQGLLRALPAEALGHWVSNARRRGLVAALAGELRLPDLPAVRDLGPDVVGVRGAACEGGRGGRVTDRRVMALRRRLQPEGFGQSSVGRPA